MNNSIESKPTGSGQTAQTNQQPAGFSRKRFTTKLAPPDQDGQLDQESRRRVAALLSRRQLAQRWSCCPHTIARRKDLKPVRFNRRFLRYRLADIEAIEAAAIA
jgi:hypothetical protein